MHSNWPYPCLFSHRLGGSLGPENTLPGLLQALPWRIPAIECDVRLSRDDIPYLLHDDTLERTTSGYGPAAALSMAELQALRLRDQPETAGTLPTLAELAATLLPRGIVANLELKPAPGEEHRAGEVVARVAQQLWQGQRIQPLLSSFSEAALAAAQTSVPQLPRALLIERFCGDECERLARLQAVALHVDHRQLDPQRVDMIRAAGYRLMAYTVNDLVRARELLSWGVDMICSDRPDLLSLLYRPRSTEF